jgi:hypothetical protein
LAPQIPVRVATDLHDSMAELYDKFFTPERTDPTVKGIASALAAIADNGDEMTIINILKFPLAVGPLRKALLESLERRRGRMFGGNIWCLVEQAESLGLSRADLRSPPVRSLG